MSFLLIKSFWYLNIIATILENLLKAVGAQLHWDSSMPVSPGHTNHTRCSVSISVLKMCLTFLLRSGRDRDDTGVDAVCSYNVSLANFDREKVYHELSNMTNGVTKLGHYSLEKNSLYVNGKNPRTVSRCDFGITWRSLLILPLHWSMSIHELSFWFVGIL